MGGSGCSELRLCQGGPHTRRHDGDSVGVLLLTSQDPCTGLGHTPTLQAWLPPPVGHDKGRSVLRASPAVAQSGQEMRQS